MKTQVNYVRACFCTERVLDLLKLRQLGIILENHGCQIIGPPEINSGQWYEQSVALQARNGSWAARLIQISSDPLACATVSFDVDSLLFLPGDTISYDPLGDPAFTAYKDLLIDIVQELKPSLGIVDYDADLLCKDLRSNSFAAWGNYLSNEFLATWDSQEIELIPNIVDEYVVVENRGILTFNHPLGYGDSSENQVKIWNTIKSYIV